jgi:tetratricopeptide (TPR) repeat protein
LMALMEGDFDVVGQLIESELSPGPSIMPTRDNVSAATFHRFLLAREKGRPAEAEEGVRAAVVEFAWYPLHRAALVLLLIDLGREIEAREQFATLAAGEFRALYRDNEWLLGMSLASEACALLGEEAAAETLYEQLVPFAGRHAIGQVEGSMGAVDRYLGLLARTMGRSDEAEGHLTEAIRLNERMGARPWVAHTQHDLASVLRQRNAAGDHRRAAELEQAALQTARSLGMTALAARIEESGTGASGQAPSLSPIPSPGAAIFRREGEYWTISFGSDSFRLRDAKGLRYLVRLLCEPGRELLALDLAQAGASRTAKPPIEPDLRQTDLGDAGAQLDEQAKQAYRHRLHELQQELDEAESWNDPERAERARGEMDDLARELARAIGLGGRDRAAGSVSERARVSVTRAIRLAMARIADHSPALGDHLESTIHTGTYCAYRPDTRLPVTWQQ